MAISDIPTSFGTATFMRNFLPGFLFLVIFSYTFSSYISIISNAFNSLDIVNKLLIWTILGFVFGLIISSLDFAIYKLLSGYNLFHPSIGYIYAKLNGREIAKYNELIKTLKSSRNEIEQNPQNEQACNLNIRCSTKLKMYPFNKDKKYYYPQTWTRLGNVIAEYENYSKVCYEMSFNVFWHRLWYLLSKEVQDDISERGAKADFFSYMAFLFLIYSPFAGIGWYPQVKNFMLSLSYLPSWSLFPLVWLISFILSLLAFYILYDMAVRAHENYGGYIEALFDLHHPDILKLLRYPSHYENEICREFSQNFESYRHLR